METVRIEGIILQAIAYKEADRIITAWTPQGILKVFFRGSYSKKNNPAALTAPLQQVEFVYLKRQHELGLCREISLLDPLFHLRGQLERLESAGEIARSILASQSVDSPAPLLYALSLRYLQNLHNAIHPFLLAASLQLKILRHEGMLALAPVCSVCQQQLVALYIAEGECFCAEHAPAHRIAFDTAETLLLGECSYGRSMQKMCELECGGMFLEKVRRLFHAHISV